MMTGTLDSRRIHLEKNVNIISKKKVYNMVSLLSLFFSLSYGFFLIVCFTSEGC